MRDNDSSGDVQLWLSVLEGDGRTAAMVGRCWETRLLLEIDAGRSRAHERLADVFATMLTSLPPVVLVDVLRLALCDAIETHQEAGAALKERYCTLALDELEKVSIRLRAVARHGTN